MRPLRPLGTNLPFLREGVLGEMPRMAFGRVASPVNDEVRSVLDFA